MLKFLSVAILTLSSQMSLALPSARPADSVVTSCQFKELELQALVSSNRVYQIVDDLESTIETVTAELQDKNGKVVKALRDCNVALNTRHCAFQVSADTRIELNASFAPNSRQVNKVGIVVWTGDSPKGYVSKDCSLKTNVVDESIN